MSEAEASSGLGAEAPARQHASVGFLAAAGAGAAILAAIGLWSLYGEGVYGQALLNAVIACF